MLRILDLLLRVCNLRGRPLPKDLCDLKMGMRAQSQNNVIDLIKGVKEGMNRLSS